MGNGCSDRRPNQRQFIILFFWVETFRMMCILRTSGPEMLHHNWAHLLLQDSVGAFILNKQPDVCFYVLIWKKLIVQNRPLQISAEGRGQPTNNMEGHVLLVASHFVLCAHTRDASLDLQKRELPVSLMSNVSLNSCHGNEQITSHTYLTIKEI